MLSRVNERVSIAINRNSFIQTFVALDTYRAYDYPGAHVILESGVFCTSRHYQLVRIRYNIHGTRVRVPLLPPSASRQSAKNGRKDSAQSNEQPLSSAAAAFVPGRRGTRHAASTVVIASASAAGEQ